MSLQITLPRGVQRSTLQDPRHPTSYTVPRRRTQGRGGKEVPVGSACPVTGQDHALSEEQVKSRAQPRRPLAMAPTLSWTATRGRAVPLPVLQLLACHLLGEGGGAGIKGPLPAPLLLPLHSYIPQSLLCTSPPPALHPTHTLSCHRSAG